MFVWADGTVTGSVNVEELERIQKTMKSAGKKQLADVAWPIESDEQLVNQLAAPEPETKAKASSKKEET